MDIVGRAFILFQQVALLRNKTHDENAQIDFYKQLSEVGALREESPRDRQEFECLGDNDRRDNYYKMKGDLRRLTKLMKAMTADQQHLMQQTSQLRAKL